MAAYFCAIWTNLERWKKSAAVVWRVYLVMKYKSNHVERYLRRIMEQKLQGKDSNHCLAIGYSCRSQVKRYEKAILKTPSSSIA